MKMEIVAIDIYTDTSAVYSKELNAILYQLHWIYVFLREVRNDKRFTTDWSKVILFVINKFVLF